MWAGEGTRLPIYQYKKMPIYGPMLGILVYFRFDHATSADAKIVARTSFCQMESKGYISPIRTRRKLRLFDL